MYYRKKGLMVLNVARLLYRQLLVTLTSLNDGPGFDVEHHDW